MNRFFSPQPLWQNHGVAVLRMVIGLSLIYHGCEMFDTAAMNEYLKWDMFKDQPIGKWLVYLGKGFELAGGVLLLAGLFTRVACIIIIVTLAYITFVIGHGKIWYDDQYPFLFVLFGFTFLFTGPGSFSLDKRMFGSKN